MRQLDRLAGGVEHGRQRDQAIRLVVGEQRPARGHVGAVETHGDGCPDLDPAQGLDVLNITGIISDTGTGHNLTKEGQGEVRLNSPTGNTYRGLTTINDGILTVGTPTALGTAANCGAGTPANGTVVNQTLTDVGQLRIVPLNGTGMTIRDEFLTLNLDGSMVPWDEIPFKDFEQKPGEFDEVVKRLKQLKLTFSVGIRGKYLLLGFGPSAEHLAVLGGAGKKLIDRPELKPLEKAAGKKLTSIGYASKDFRAKTNTNKKDLDGLAVAVLPAEEVALGLVQDAVTTAAGLEPTFYARHLSAPHQP